MSEPQVLCIDFADCIQQVAVTPLAPCVYRLEWTPLIFADEPLELYLGDTIETETQADGTLRFLSVVEYSQLRHYDWVVPQTFIESAPFEEFCAVVEAAGGRWEVLMGGWLLVHVPNDRLFDIEAELDRRIAVAMRSGLRLPR